MAAVKHVLIVGGGIGGLATAIGLKRKGVDVEIIEKKKINKVYHVGIIVQGNFIAAMGELGIAEKAISRGYPYEEFHNYDFKGGHLFSQPSFRFGNGNYPAYLGLTRPALHDVLTEEVEALGVRTRLGVTFTAIDNARDKAAVSLSDGSKEIYDLVIGADGVASDTRKYVLQRECVPEYTGQGVWRYNIPRPDWMRGMYVYRGARDQAVGLVPLSADMMYLFCVRKEDRNLRFADDKLADELRARLDVYEGPVAEIRHHITEPSLVVYRPLESLLADKPWHRGRIVLIGDAAHSSTPHMGQGAALAVEDAVVLSDELGKDQDLETALTNFTHRRYERCKIVVDAARAVGDHEMNPQDGTDVAGLFAKVYETLSQPL